MPFLVEKLHVYRRAVDFADHVLAATERFPRGTRRSTMADRRTACAPTPMVR